MFVTVKNSVKRRINDKRNIKKMKLVIGCPFPGMFGTNCSTPCPDPNCRYCHIETGACQGCRPGYQGHRCETGIYEYF